jgi:hypothetical protein
MATIGILVNFFTLSIILVVALYFTFFVLVEKKAPKAI